MQISVRAEVASAQAFFRDLGKRAVPKAAARAINDTLTTLRKDGAQAMKAEHGALKIGAIKKEMHVNKANAWKLRGEVYVRGTPLSLKLLRATQTKRGVTAKIGNARQALVLYHGRKAFIVSKYNDEIFVRADASGRRIRRFRGPSMPGIFRAREKRFKQIVAQRFPRAFKSRMDYEIHLAAKRAAL